MQIWTTPLRRAHRAHPNEHIICIVLEFVCSRYGKGQNRRRPRGSHGSQSGVHMHATRLAIIGQGAHWGAPQRARENPGRATRRPVSGRGDSQGFDWRAQGRSVGSPGYPSFSIFCAGRPVQLRFKTLMTVSCPVLDAHRLQCRAGHCSRANRPWGGRFGPLNEGEVLHFSKFPPL
jgi:hypothetical protein